VNWRVERRLCNPPVPLLAESLASLRRPSLLRSGAPSGYHTQGTMWLLISSIMGYKQTLGGLADLGQPEGQK
jgi:hypothetical protein